MGIDSHPQRFRKRHTCTRCSDDDCCRPWSTISPGGHLACQPIFKDNLTEFELAEYEDGEWQSAYSWSQENGSMEVFFYMYQIQEADSYPIFGSKRANEI